MLYRKHLKYSSKMTEQKTEIQHWQAQIYWCHKVPRNPRSALPNMVLSGGFLFCFVFLIDETFLYKTQDPGEFSLFLDTPGSALVYWCYCYYSNYFAMDFLISSGFLSTLLTLTISIEASSWSRTQVFPLAQTWGFVTQHAHQMAKTAQKWLECDSCLALKGG